MSDKIFSISKAIREMLGKGVLTGYERECHFMLQREAESMGEHKWMYSGNARDLALYCPIELFTTRQLTTSGFPIGTWTEGVSNLVTWSACAKAGATFLTGLSRNTNLWQIGQLPVPEWLPELGQVTPSDPLFAGYPVSPKRISGLSTLLPTGCLEKARAQGIARYHSFLSHAVRESRLGDTWRAFRYQVPQFGNFFYF